MLPRKAILLTGVTVLLLISSMATAKKNGTADDLPDADEGEDPLGEGEGDDPLGEGEGGIGGKPQHEGRPEGGSRPSNVRPSKPHPIPESTTRGPRPHTTTYDYPFTPYEPSDNRRRKGSNRQRYGDDDLYGDDGDYREVGRGGEHPGEYGRDYADFGPVLDDGESMYGSMNIWIRAADDWEERGRSNSNNKYRGKKYRKGKGRDYSRDDNNYNKDRDYGRDDNNYNKDRDYDRDDNKGRQYDADDKGRDYGGKGRDYGDKGRDYDSKGKYDNNDNKNDYKKSDRKKRSYSRVKFPVRHFKDIRRFPQRSFPPLLSIFPWLPIFYDRISYQTFIFSPTGGIYILPPLINFYGQRFAVAQLIKWGYASLVSSGAPPPPNVNVAPLVAPAPAGGAVVGGVAGGVGVGAGAGAGAGAPAPRYDTAKNRFTGGVRTDFPDFKPRYASTFEDKSYGGSRAVDRNTYGRDSNYGGTGRQEVYPQGGPRSGGGGYN